MKVPRFDRVVGLFAVLTVVASSAVAQEGGGWVGKRVIIKFGAALEVDGQALDDEGQFFLSYRVEGVKGPWLRLSAEGGAQTAGSRSSRSCLTIVRSTTTPASSAPIPAPWLT